MKIDILNIGMHDHLLVSRNIGNLTTAELNRYCKKFSNDLKEIFECPISLLPTRDGPECDFTVIRNPRRTGFVKKKKR